MNDQSLTDSTTPAPGPFGDPTGATLPVTGPMSVEDVIASARRREKVSRICVRADLQARHDEILEDLAQLVSPRGELIQSEDDSLGDESAATKAQRLTDELNEVRGQMSAAMWSVRFRAMPTDEWAVWVKATMPKGEEPDLAPFHVAIVAKVAVAPELTQDQVTRLRGVLAPSQFMKLANDAYKTCTEGGLDIPKSPLSLRNLTAQ